MKSILHSLISKIDTFTEYSGKCVSLLVIILVFIVGYDVSMRYLFNSGSVAIQELEWHLFSIIFLFVQVIMTIAKYAVKYNDDRLIERTKDA